MKRQKTRYRLLGPDVNEPSPARTRRLPVGPCTRDGCQEEARALVSREDALATVVNRQSQMHGL